MKITKEKLKQLIKEEVEKSLNERKSLSDAEVNDFLEIVYNNTNNNCYPADYELYGNFCFKYHRDKIDLKHLNYNFFGRDVGEKPFWEDDEITNLINTILFLVQNFLMDCKKDMFGLIFLSTSIITAQKSFFFISL